MADPHRRHRHRHRRFERAAVRRGTDAGRVEGGAEERAQTVKAGGVVAGGQPRRDRPRPGRAHAGGCADVVHRRERQLLRGGVRVGRRHGRRGHRSRRRDGPG